ncbi:MCE family protein [bacterium]|nr:MCE family protein [bacterium]MBU1074006.1 MCE family protein [bacterium]MBU1676408.1 MCE family protein [bacterium]
MGSKKEVQVGIAVILSLIILVWGTLWFKQVRFSGGIERYFVEFNSVGGLQGGDRVQVRGIRLGAVEDFDIHGDKVRVRFYLDDLADLRQDAKITLTSQGIVGEMLLEILPGKGETAPEGYVFQGRALQDMNAMMDEGTETLADTRALTREVTEFLAEIREGGRLLGVIDDTRHVMNTFERVTGDIAPDIETLVADLDETANAIRMAVAGPDSLLTGALQGAEASLARVDTLSQQLTRATTLLTEVLRRLEAGEGSAGRLLRDDSLYARAESTIVAVQDLIADMKARPKRYFHVSLF